MMQDQLSSTFAALADPTRRAILARLASGETSVSELAKPFDMSMPAISKHLKVLERIELLDNDTMRDRITLTDPEVYTRQWTVDRLYKRAKNYEISEYICNTNGAAIPPSGEVH